MKRAVLILGLALASGAIHAAGPAPAGRVVPDPRTQQRIDAPQAGTLEAPPGGFPEPGARVHAGQVLAWLRPSLPEPERRDLDAALAAARRDVDLGALQVRRFNAPEADQFDGQMALPSLQILGDYRSAQARKAQLEAALAGRVALVAPRDATVLRSRARTDRTLGRGAPVFELDAPGGAAVEMLLTDPAVPATAYTHAQTLSGQSLALQPISERFDAGLRARRVIYAVSASETSDAPAPGEPVVLRGE